MLKDLFDTAAQVLTLARDSQQNRNDIRDTRDEVKSLRSDLADLEDEVHELSMALQRLTFEIQRVSERETHEREKLALRLDNILLQFERRLPPGD